jgi:hypothetical protein
VIKARSAVTGHPTRRQGPGRAYHRGYYCYIANLRGLDRNYPKIGCEHTTIDILPKSEKKQDRLLDAYFQEGDVFIRRWDGGAQKIVDRGGRYTLESLSDEELQSVGKQKQALERILKWETTAYCSVR